VLHSKNKLGLKFLGTWGKSKIFLNWGDFTQEKRGLRNTK
jgi:hypothetical protein